MASIVGSNTEAALIFGDPITAEEYMTSLERESDIGEAILYDKDQNVFAVYQREKDQEIPPIPSWIGPRMAENEVMYVQPIMVASERIGTLLISANNTALQKHSRQSLVISVIVFFAGLLITILLAFGMQPLISRPLVSLAGLAQKVSEQKDYSIRAKKLYDDEIGSLVDNFNFMLATVQQRDEDLNASHRDLEVKIADRTAKLRIAMEEAQAASKAKSEFLSTMSHELRTPMNAIVGMASMLNDSDLDDERRGYIKLIRQSSDALLSLVNNVLDYSKIEAGRLDIEHKPFSLLACAESAMNIVAAQVPETELQLFVSYDPRLPKNIYGDSTRLRQILVNLVGNAVKFTEKGHVWLKVNFEKGESEKPNLVIEVIDTGIGIPEDRLNRLFQSFSQVDSSTTRKYGGTGLGLAISQRLARAMGGSIEVQSNPGIGSVFSIRFKLEECDGTDSILGTSPWRKNSHPKIQIDGIENPFVTSIEQMLKFWGAVLVNNDSESSTQPDLIIQGVMAEKTHSNQSIVLEAIQKNPSIPILFITRQSNWTEVRKVTTHPITTIPFHVEDLTTNLTAMLQGHQNPEMTKATEEQQEELVLPRGKQAKILLVEDNIVNQKVFSLMLGKLGLKTDLANNGEEAVQTVKENYYDLIFMDFQMPVMDGIEATRLIRAMETDIQQPWIIGFTANVQKDTVSEMRRAGMDSYISKPVKFPDLRKVIDNYTETIAN